MIQPLHQVITRTKKTALLIVVLFFLALNYGFSQDNLITNGDFENGTTGWTVWGATLATSTDAHSGNSAALVTNRNNPWDALVRDLTSILKSGETYKLSTWVKLPEATKNFRITIQLDVDGTLTYHGFSRTNNPTIGSYVQYNSEVNLEWSGKLNSASMYFETEDIEGVYTDYLVDDVELTQYNPPVDIIQTGKGWKDIRSTMLIGGCVTDGTKNYFNNEAAKAQVLKDCNTVNVQAYPAWGRWDEEKMHVYHLDQFTSQVKEMKQKNMKVTMHMMLGWDKYFPEWFRKGDFEVDTLDAIMKSWFSSIITKEGNDTLVDVWNVVNESLSWDGKGGYWPIFNDDYEYACEFQRMGFEADKSGLTGDEFVNAEHPVYIGKAFKLARTLTDKKLELRETSCEFPGDQKYEAFYQLAVHLKNTNVPIDVIGLQSHLNLNSKYDWEAYSNNIKRFIDLGYEVVIPEVDIGDTSIDWTEEKAEKQKLMYYQLVAAAIKGGANDFQTWGFIDNPNNSWRAEESAFPYTYNYEAKPAYYGITEALVDMSSILYWEMDTTIENQVPDVMTYNNHGYFYNSTNPEIVTGYKGKALKFDGVSNYVASNKLSDSIPADLTFYCYIKTANTKNAVIANLVSESGSELVLGINQNGKIYLNSSENGLVNDLEGSKVVNDDEWHFIAIQRDSTSYKLYNDDAVPVAQTQGTVLNFNKLVIGARTDGTSNFQGAIDEVKLYDSAIEENSFMRSYAPIPPNNLTFFARDLKIRLNWSDRSDNEDGFIIERKLNDENWEEVARVPANTKVFVETLTNYNTNHTYRIRAFTTAGQSAESNTVTYLTPEDPSTGIEEYSEDLIFSVYPNPAQNNIWVKSAGSIKITLLDIQGRTIFEKANCNELETFDISEISNGMYFLKASDNENSNVLKLIKK